MRKLLIFVLSVLMFLTSCSIDAKRVDNALNEIDTTDKSKEDTKTQNEAESLTTAPAVEKNVFYLPSLPDIGEFSGNLQNDRFHDEITYDFIPSDEYGKIIPYIGSYRIFRTNYGDGYDAEVGYASYGFCSPDGKIVMDASDKNTYIHHFETDDGFGYYTVTREISVKDDAPDEYMPGETYIIPSDGTWVLKLDEGSWVSSVGGGRINICDYPNMDSPDEQVKTLVYDYDRNLVKTLEGVDSTGTYYNGLTMVSDWTDNGYSACFVDDEGNTVFGPFSSANNFNEYGITAVKDENGAYLMNFNGERLTDYYESFYREFSGDMERELFSGRHYSDRKINDVYSANGRFIGIVNGSTYSSFRFPDNGEILYYYTYYPENDKGYPIYNAEKMIWKHLSDGTDFVSKEFGFSPNSYSGTDNCFIHIDKDNKTGYFFNGNGETIAVIDGISEVTCTSEYGEYIVYIEGEYDYGYDEQTGEPNEDTRTTHLYDSEKGEIVYSFDGYGYANFVDKDKRFIKFTVYDQTEFAGLDKCWLFDTQSRQIVFEECEDIAVYDVDGDTYISVCYQNSSAVYDEDLNIIRKSYFEY